MPGKFSTNHISLRRRICIAVSLVSVIPAIVIFNYFFGYIVSAYATAALTVLIILGWWLILEISNSIHRIHDKSQKTLAVIGESAPTIPDEVRSLEEIISLLSSKVKTGFEELREFGNKTEQLNREVSKKVLVLSTILQANDLYSKDTPLEEIIQFLIYHLKNLLVMKVSLCVLQLPFSEVFKIISCLGADSEKTEKVLSEKKAEIPYLKRTIIVDKENKAPGHIGWAQELGADNLLIFPIISRDMTIGFLAIGTDRQDFVFEKDDVDLLNLFAQNITLIWEYEKVSSKVKELEIFDDLTGLYNSKTLEQKLDDEIKRCVVYQRPCGLVAVKIKNYSQFQKDFGIIEAEKAVKKTAKILKDNIRAIDVGARIGPETLAVILVEKNKRQSKEVCKVLQEKAAESSGGKIELSFCVVGSPVDGVTAEEILLSVQSQLN